MSCIFRDIICKGEEKSFTCLDKVLRRLTVCKEFYTKIISILFPRKLARTRLIYPPARVTGAFIKNGKTPRYHISNLCIMHKFKKKTIVDFSVRHLRDVSICRKFIFFFNLELTKDTWEIPYKIIVSMNFN